MQSPSRLFIILLVLICLSTIISTTKAQSELRYVHCPNTTTFSSNSTYENNLRMLLSSLSSNGTPSTGFYNSSAGQDPDDVYGLYLCQGGDGTDDCEQCVNQATENALKLCQDGKVAVIWYDNCFIRYSNMPVSPSLDQGTVIYFWNSQNLTGTNQASFMELVATTLSEIAAEAAVSPRKFAAKDVNYTSGSAQKVYTIAQCTPDLTTSNCQQCLQSAVNQLPSCCNNRPGGRVVTPSCYFRYETYAFYNTSAFPSPPPPVPSIVPSQPPPPTTPFSSSRGRNRITIIVIATIAPIVASMLLFCAGYCFLRRRSRKKYNIVQQDGGAVSKITDVESLQFDFATLEAATNNFSTENKLGQGGFGEVYKGTLHSGQEVAVKRLSKNSGQGAEEFKNEVLLVAKLQHRNLVRLQGFCLEGEEKMLVYEYVANKSLDYSLFDPEKQGQLDWSRRYKIIGGIARGILYLHQDSQLRIIHRDLKASNVLLDGDMNPKISDFGMARIFGVDQTQANTGRIVGTYGYMAPEYAMHGHFSVKSDVYSFGVLVLEIISGKKNSSFYTEGSEDLLSYVWKHWRDGTPLQVLDPTLADAYSRNEAIRCIQIGLLCVQEDPAERLRMETVVLMLNSYSVTLPVPHEPAFFYQSRSNQSLLMKGSESEQSTTTKSIPVSVDEASITEVYPR